jgi:uncharacterized protein
MPKKAKKLPNVINQALDSTDLIIHLGDWQNIELYHELQQIAPVEGIAGNVDDQKVIQLLGFKKIISYEGIEIGLTHGHLGKGRSTEDRALRTFESISLDIILFGHSHIPVHKNVNGVVLFNPGSPTDKRRQTHYSFGIIEVCDGKYQINHVFFQSKE